MIVDTLLTKSLEEQEQNEFLKSVRGQINKLDFFNTGIGENLPFGNRGDSIRKRRSLYI